MKVLIAVGGTGGHLFPAEILAEDLSKEHEVIFAGKGLKNGFFHKNFPYYEIASGSVHPKKILTSSFKILFGFFRALWMMRKEKFAVAVGFGSYHAFPVLLAATVLRIPITLFESNIDLGMVNRVFAKKAHAIGMLFPSPKYHNAALVHPLFKHVPKEKKDLMLHPKIFTILVFGGSQGALFLNQFFLKVSKNLKKRFSFQVIHLTGKNVSQESVTKTYDEYGITAYVSPFEKDMAPLYGAADFVIARAGAGTITELFHHELPAILVPFPFAKDNHQLKNALFYQTVVGTPSVFEQKDLAEDVFIEALEKFFKEDHYSVRKKLKIYKEKQKKVKRLSMSSLVLKVGENR